MAIENLAPVMLTNGLANAVSGSESEAQGESSSWSEGGSSNSAQSISGSQGSSQGTSWGNVAGLEASANSALEAERAHERQKELLQMAQQYNSTEAEKTRNWQANMANTVYTRSIRNMIAAGINPILAANLGLSAGNINTGATASVSTPSSFMGQTFAEQNSASQNSSSSSSFGQSSEQGKSYNKSGSKSNEWSNSQSGLATGLRQMMALGEDALNAINSSDALRRTMDLFGATKDTIKDAAEQMGQDFWNYTEKYKKDYWEGINPDFQQGYGR